MCTVEVKGQRLTFGVFFNHSPLYSFSFLRCIYFIILCVCVFCLHICTCTLCTCMMCTIYMSDAIEDKNLTPGLELDSCQIFCGCWDSHLGPQQEQQCPEQESQLSNLCLTFWDRVSHSTWSWPAQLDLLTSQLYRSPVPTSLERMWAIMPGFLSCGY